MDNELVLLAPVTGQFRLDLSRFAARPGPHLVACWFPPAEGRVTEAFELLAAPEPLQSLNPGPRTVPLRKRNVDPNRDVFILMLLSIGLLFGALRVTYGFSLSRFLRFQMVTRERLDDVRGTGNTPFSTPLTLLLVFAFLLSFSLFVTMIHTKLENNLLSRYLFALSDADVTLRVGLYALVGLVFIAARYAFLWIIGYVFDLSAVVFVQYREFVQTLIFTGLYLPLIIVLHLALSVRAPALVLLLSNSVVFMLLGVLVVRTGLEIRRRQSLLNLQLFSYLCATEVIPLTILLKAIVFPAM